MTNPSATKSPVRSTSSWVRTLAFVDDRGGWNASVVADLSHWSSPVLLIHCDQDRNVDFSRTITLAKSPREQGVETELLMNPNDLHGLLLHANWRRAEAATAEFLIRKLSP